MAGQPKFTKQQVIEALQASRGLASVAARRLGCTHQTVVNYMRRYPDVAEVAQRQRDQMTDVAELKFWQALQNGEVWAITLQLKTQGRDRGYIEQHDFNFILNRAVRELADEAGLTFEEVMAEADEIRRTRR
jgi:hypothetical protein